MDLASCSDTRRVLIAYAVLLLATMIPIWTVEYLPLQDYPNHLARMFIIEHLDGDPTLQRYYRVQLDILPNLGMELVVLPLAKILSLQVSGKICISLAILLFTSGPLYLHRVLSGQLSYWPLLSFLLVFNDVLIKGFVSYLLGVGLAIWAIGLWIAIGRKSHWSSAILFPLLSMAIFTFHLYAFAFYVAATVLYEISGICDRRMRRSAQLNLLSLGLALLQSLPSVYLYLQSPTGVVGHKFIFVSLLHKLFTYPLKLVPQYNPWVDGATLAFLLTVVSAGVWNTKLRPHARMLPAIVFFTILYFAMPAILSKSANSDWRLLIPLSLLILSSLIPAKTTRSFGSLTYVLLGLLVAANTTVVTQNWRRAQHEYGAMMAAIDQIQEGSRLFSARGFESYRGEAYPFMHAPSLAVIRKSAYVPSMFADEIQQPLRFSGRYKDVALRAPNSIYTVDQQIPWEFVLQEYDYLLAAREELLSKMPRGDLHEVFRRDDIALYVIKPNRTPSVP